MCRLIQCKAETIKGFAKRNHHSVFISQNQIIMKSHKSSPTDHRRFSYFSNFKSSKRVRWSESRNYVH